MTCKIPMHTPMITKIPEDDFGEFDEDEYVIGIPELKNQEILYKTPFMDGTLYILKGLVPLKLDVIIESFDLVHKSAIFLDSNRPLSEVLTVETLQLIKSSYLRNCLTAKNEDVTHGISSVH